MNRHALAGLVAFAASCGPTLAPAQSLPVLARSTALTGLNDSALFLVSDSARRTRAATLATLRTLFGSSFPLLATDGTAAAPPYSFTNSTGLGMYRFGADTLGFATAGVHSLRVSGGATVKLTGGAGNMNITAGTGANRRLVLSATTAASAASNVLFITSSGTQVFNGSAGLPSYTFQNDSTTGLYLFGGADTLGFSTAGANSWKMLGGASAKLIGGAGNSTIQAGTGASRTLSLATTNSGSAAVSVLTMSNTLATFDVGAYQLVFGTGTAAAPSLQFGNGGGGGARGIYSVGSDTLGIATVGVKSLQITGGAAATITGGAGSMTLLAGTGNSRTMTLQSTTSAGAVKNTLLLGADSMATFLGQIKAIDGTASIPSYRFASATNTGWYYSSSPAGANLSINGTLHGTFSGDGGGGLTIASGTSFALTGGTGNMTLTAGTGASRTMTLQTTTSGSTAKNTLVLGADSSTTALGRVSAGAGFVFTGGPLPNTANTGSLGWVSGSGSVLTAFGANGSTNGDWQVITRASDGTNNLTVIRSDFATAPGGILLAGSRFTFDTSGTLSGSTRGLTIRASASSASQRVVLQTTTSGGTPTTALRLNEVQQSLHTDGAIGVPSVAFASDSTTGFYKSGTNQISYATGGSEIVRFGNGPTTFLGDVQGVSNLNLVGGSGANRTLTMKATNSSSVVTTFAIGNGDTLKFSGHAIATGFTAASGTPGSICYITATSELTKNNATSCVVSSIRFKDNVWPLALDSAKDIVNRLTPVTYTMKDGGRPSLHVIAEQADSISKRLSFRNPDGLVNSVDDGAILSALLRVVQDQQRQLDSLKTVLRGRKP